MIQEYITRLQRDNDAKLSSLEKEMNDLVQDLSRVQRSREELEINKLKDSNIFSPRLQDVRIDEKLQLCKLEIRQLNEKIDYVRQMIEECLRNREEFKKLEEELHSLDSEHMEILQEPEKHNVQKEEWKQLLLQLRNKTENSLMLLNGNKNRCRTELKGMLSLIKEFECRF